MSKPARELPGLVRDLRLEYLCHQELWACGLDEDQVVDWGVVVTAPTDEEDLNTNRAQIGYRRVLQAYSAPSGTTLTTSGA